MVNVVFLKNLQSNAIIYPFGGKYQPFRAIFSGNREKKATPAPEDIVTPLNNSAKSACNRPRRALCYNMVKLAEKLIQIQEFDGSQVPFDAVELQTKLIHCFLAAGLRDSSYMAEDIALAVEYTLLNSNRPEPVFGRGELGAAVVRMLEETGFPEVAALFRKNGGERLVTIDTGRESVAGLLAKFLACPPERFERIVGKVCDAAKLLRFDAASPHLLLELARHYEQLAAEEPIPTETPETPPAPAATQSELYHILPEAAQELVNDGILRINGITPIFSRISFFFMMKPFAEKFHLTPPVTELEVEPLLYRMGEILETARCAIERHLAVSESLPLYLAVPDMLDFIVDYERGERLGSEKLGRELARTLAAGFRCEVNRISIS